MCPLFDNGTHINRFIPPSRFSDSLISTSLSYTVSALIASTIAWRVHTYRALVAITVKLLSWMICFIFWTQRRYRSMYPTETMLPLSMRAFVTSCAATIVPVPTGYRITRQLILLWIEGFSKTNLFNEISSLGEHLDQVHLEICTLCRTPSVSRRTSNNDSTTDDQSYNSPDLT